MKRCPHCNALANISALDCPSCGYAFRVVVSAGLPLPESAPVAAEPVPVHVTRAGRRELHWIIALLLTLGFFFGNRLLEKRHEDVPAPPPPAGRVLLTSDPPAATKERVWIRAGMTPEEVTRQLGPPFRIKERGAQVVWIFRGADNDAEITFEGEIVQSVRLVPIN